MGGSTKVPSDLKWKGRGWRDGSAGKSSGCSSRRSGVAYNHLYITPALRELASLVSASTPALTCTYPSIHII